MKILAAIFKATALEKMDHVDRISERIGSLKGEVEIYAGQPVTKPESVKEMLELALEIERQALKTYRRNAEKCNIHHDTVTAKLFNNLMMDEENHLAEFGKSVASIENYGEQFLAVEYQDHH